jgi:8-oxo-dGTP diphosphatase
MNPGVVAKAVVIRGDKILLLRRCPDRKIAPGEWDLPGGKLEEDEDPLTAVIREAQEEAGVDIAPTIPLHVHREADTGRILIIYKAYTSQDEVILSDEHDEYRWVTREEFDQLEIPEKFRRAVRRICSLRTPRRVVG